MHLPNLTVTTARVSSVELACSAAADTVTKGGIHPRDKKPVGDRLGTAAYNLVRGESSSTV